MIRRTALVTSLAMSVAVVAAALIFIDPVEHAKDLSVLDPRLLALGLGVLAMNYWLRAWRFRLLLERGKHIPGLFGVVYLYATLNYMIPARLGELSLPLLLNKVSGQRYSEGTASLIAARALDLVALAVLFPVALLASYPVLPGWARQVGLVFTLASILSMASLVWYLRTRKPRQVQSDTSNGVTIVARLRLFSSQVLNRLTAILKQGRLPPLAPISVGVWLGISLSSFVILRAIGLELPFIAAFVVTILMLPLSFLPAQGFANLGIHEAAWLIGLTAMAVPAEVAARATLLSHMILLGYVMVMGGLGWTLAMLVRTRSPHA